jgi:excisionase family DNA binding protein
MVKYDMQQLLVDRYLNVEEAAKYLTVKKSWLYQNHKICGIPSYTLKRKLVFSIRELDEWVKSRPTASSF